MSPWESFFSSRKARRRSPIIMQALLHVGKMLASTILICGKVKHMVREGVSGERTRQGGKVRWWQPYWEQAYPNEHGTRPKSDGDGGHKPERGGGGGSQ